ncbi:PREDICTED: uncharacterized protein LOC106314357 [Brassica oleracea var. oleracea]|uniref:uncharacterized protein LOC106314357 n=1 Tax=Brassica oleracea var. oleracea TaxID=109376 RepID=UPI0006A74A98|nr:PREDICTED: uncharacterized protein LOC106314357 [Brassica oleracea var. oleracea]
MGGSPPCGNSVRSVKDYRRQVATSQRWPTSPPNHPPIKFSPDDAEGIHVPYNDPLLVVHGIGEYDVTKVLIDTGSSVDLIFRGTLQKMGVDLDDIKPSSRTLTGFNGSSETILGTIRLPVHASGVTRTVKFAVCVKFPGTDGKIKTLRGDQKAARELLVATVKLQRSSLSVNSVSPPTYKACSQEGEVLELPIDDTNPSRTARIGAYLSEDMQRYPLSNIDRLVESTAGNEMLTFMDAFSGYNQIMMHPDDREKTAFITERGTYCYKVMPFGLKNAEATYQRLVNKMFADKLGITMEVYIDDMLVKSLHAADHLCHLQDCFKTLNKYGMKLNPAKCTFGVSSGEFLGYIVTQRGIEANPKQISAVLNLPSHKNSRKVQRLTGNKRFIWDEKCEEAFTQLKHYLTTPPVLAKPDIGDILSLYVAVSQAAVSSVLIKEDRGEQKPIFYTSRRMSGPETRYPTLQKMALAVVEAARKLRLYFQSHSVEVLTDQPLRTILQNTNRSGRLTKWAIELGAGVQLQSPTGELIRQSFSFGFPASNNEAEYESLIAGLRLAKAVKAKRLSAYCDSQLVATEFEFFELVKVRRGENVCADALAALGSKLRDQVKRTIPIHRIEKPGIDISTDQTIVIAPITETDMLVTDEFGPDWRTEFIDYLSKGELPTEKWAARRPKTRSAHDVVLDNELHRWTASKVLLKCIYGEETVRVMAKIHEGAGGNHSDGRALAIKARSLGFFWPTMNADCESYARSCDKCQRHTPSIHCPTEMLQTTVAPYPFMRWAMDIIGPLPCSR